ncbi:MAG TPA: hypothetical protein VGJ84_07875 [Polyangiaceae bacterium]
MRERLSSLRLRRLHWGGRVAPVAAVVLGLIAFSLPPLLNAAGTQSDASVVGLQAAHLLRGEWSWFLWGSGYQTSVDSVVAALAFLVLGPSPLALTLSTFAGHVALIVFAYATVERRVGPWPAALLVSPLVFTPAPLHIYIFYPPRQAALTWMFAAIWVLDRAPAKKWPGLWLAGGAFGAGLACFADPYVLLFLPPLAVFIWLTAREDVEGAVPNRDSLKTRRVLVRTAAGFAGGLVGLVPLWFLYRSAGASHSVYAVSGGVLSHNFKLLMEQCLPSLMSTTVYFTPEMPVTQVWQAPIWFQWIQIAGAAALVAGVALGGAAFAFRRLPLMVQRLGVFGASVWPVTLGAFLVSLMVMDRLSARYLNAMILTAPFALTPGLCLLGARRFALALSPYLISAGVAGWLNYGNDVNGWRMRLENGRAQDEQALMAMLRARGIHYGTSDYWVAYRFTFLARENPTVVPWQPQLDRYPPYRSAFQTQSTVAYLFDPWRSGEALAYREAQIRNGATDFEPVFGKYRVGRYSVLILKRRSER